MAKDPQAAPEGGAGEAQAQQAQVQLDESHALAAYANFCRVTGTPEEVIFDFGLNTQPGRAPSQPIAVKQRMILSYYTAKRMLIALSMTIQRHEQAFGVLETDVNKRVQAARQN